MGRRELALTLRAACTDRGARERRTREAGRVRRVAVRRGQAAWRAFPAAAEECPQCVGILHSGHVQAQGAAQRHDVIALAFIEKPNAETGALNSRLTNRIE
ncbi:hypothetical protein BTM_3700 [Burkholderia thailandensis 34]|uniref:hypothetical protein n=1 Tax=Burkholderia thailandensis TaxID=57975 RepID=UPI0005D9A5B8|nr:hypothetical protein [Burkholderia thailandensis]AJY32902.1 hypothetical protein BTM_3700 [Burkholderia thailandensis 34]